MLHKKSHFCFKAISLLAQAGKPQLFTDLHKRLIHHKCLTFPWKGCQSHSHRGDLCWGPLEPGKSQGQDSGVLHSLFICCWGSFSAQFTSVLILGALRSYSPCFVLSANHRMVCCSCRCPNRKLSSLIMKQNFRELLNPPLSCDSAILVAGREGWALTQPGPM